MFVCIVCFLLGTLHKFTYVKQFSGGVESDESAFSSGELLS